MSDNGSGDLGERIAAAQRAREARENKPDREVEQATTSAGALALRYGAEFAASVAVGIGLGLLIDHFAGTRPWGLLVMMMFGLAAGILSVIRAYRELTAEAAKMNESEAVASEDNEI